MVTAQRCGEGRFSLTPRFIAVEATSPKVRNGFNRLLSPVKETVKTVAEVSQCGAHRDESRC